MIPLQGGIALDADEVTTPGLFSSMADVFGKAIERALCEEFGTQNVHSQAEYKDRIQIVDGGAMIPVTFIPDNVVGPKDAPWLIVDAKYKNHNYGDRFRGTDLYQAFHLCRRTRCASGATSLAAQDCAYVSCCSAIAGMLIN